MNRFKIVGLISILVVTFIGSNVTAGILGNNQFENEVIKEEGAVKLSKEVIRGNYDVIKTADFKKLISEKKDLIIVDTMPYESSYKKNHIPGAKQFLFPIPDMLEWDSTKTDGKLLTDFEKLLGADKNKTIVVYCGFVKCTRSHNGAMWAKKLGYKNVYRHPGGVFAWKGAGLPLDSKK